MQMKVKLFTHSDLDGIGCAILAKIAFKDVHIEYVDYKDVNDKVYEFINTGKIEEYNVVFITDISVNQDIAEIITAQYCDKVVLIDHHGSVDWLNQYEWAQVTVSYATGLTSGTSLFYDYLICNDYLKSSKDFNDLVEAIRRYDTWEWKTKYDDQNASRLNMLFSLLGRYKFIERMISNLSFFTQEDLDMLDREEERKERYINSTIKTVVKKPFVLSGTRYNVAVVFAESDISELGNVICEENEDVDFCIIINMQNRTLSYRTVRDDLDLGKDIASIFGGGGHAKAAGSRINDDKLAEVINSIIRL
jgi:oligoribonuclease NrnB/cAMP/cGMP phosphodiesterase (DHH superfamily)